MVSRSTWTKVAVAGTAAAVVALGGPAVASAEQGAILGADSKNAIEGSYLVVLKDGVSTRAESSAHADQYDAKVTRTFKSALRGYAAKMSESDAKRLAADSSVAYVEQNQRVSVAADQLNPPSWGLDRVDQRDLPLDDKYSYSTTAGNVTAYIIDTGIRTSHSTFEGRATWGTNTVDSNNTDCNGHGTHVAGTVGGEEYGLAKEVKLVAVKVLNCQGSGSYDGVIAGIDWVTGNHQAGAPAVANMSLGGGASQAVDDAVRRSISDGVTYALAAGNDYGANACNTSPARTQEAITVGSTTTSDARSSFSNIGSCLDIFAPGSGITSAWNSSDSSTNTISGTSMATPHVAGGAALYLADNPSASPQTVRDHLVSNGTQGKVTDPGSGSPNVLLYTGAGGTDPEPPTGCSGTNANNVDIPDAGGAVTSTIAIGNCDRNASSSAKVAEDI
ncbi:MAG: S8 family peptidase, partial [Thermocrispum sp.]